MVPARSEEDHRPITGIHQHVPNSGRTPAPGGLNEGLLSVWCLTAAVALQGAPIASAQDYPSKPIRAIGGSAPGGISDVFIRTLGEELHKRSGQPIVVEN